jgi:hypothetical protein
MVVIEIPTDLTSLPFLVADTFFPSCFATAFSRPYVNLSHFFGHPAFFATVQSGQKCNPMSVIHPFLTHCIVILALAYMSDGSCNRHCTLFHQIGMVLTRVICGRIVVLSTTAAL